MDLEEQINRMSKAMRVLPLSPGELGLTSAQFKPIEAKLLHMEVEDILKILHKIRVKRKAHIIDYQRAKEEKMGLHLGTVTPSADDMKVKYVIVYKDDNPNPGILRKQGRAENKRSPRKVYIKEESPKRNYFIPGRRFKQQRNNFDEEQDLFDKSRVRRMKLVPVGRTTIDEAREGLNRSDENGFVTPERNIYVAESSRIGDRNEFDEENQRKEPTPVYRTPTKEAREGLHRSDENAIDGQLVEREENRIRDHNERRVQRNKPSPIYKPKLNAIDGQLVKRLFNIIAKYVRTRTSI